MRTQESQVASSHVPCVEDELIETVHDLKSPLATISLEMGLLRDRLAYSAAPEVRSALVRIVRNVAFIDRLIADLLDSSAIEAGAFSVQRQPTELCALVNEVIERAVATRDRSRIYFDSSGRISVCVDAARIERVLANLLQNAIKYAPLESSISVDVERTATHVCVTVTDSGPGVAATERETIFERHQRTAYGRTREGSGLGLYVSRKIIEAHGGKIGVRPMRTAGTRFYFELPLG